METIIVHSVWLLGELGEIVDINYLAQGLVMVAMQKVHPVYVLNSRALRKRLPPSSGPGSHVKL